MPPPSPRNPCPRMEGTRSMKGMHTSLHPCQPRPRAAPPPQSSPKHDRRSIDGRRARISPLLPPCCVRVHNDRSSTPPAFSSKPLCHAPLTLVSGQPKTNFAPVLCNHNVVLNHKNTNTCFSCFNAWKWVKNIHYLWWNLVYGVLAFKVDMCSVAFFRAPCRALRL